MMWREKLAKMIRMRMGLQGIGMSDSFKSEDVDS